MSRKIKVVVTVLFLVVVLALSFGAGCTIGTVSLPKTEPGLGVVEEVWGIIFRDYVDREKLDTGALTEAAIKGILEELDDPYTSYLDEQAYQLSLSGLEGKFEGIGAHVGIREGKLMIIAPIAASPAAKAGVRAGDIVLEVDGKSTSEMSLEESVLHIRGPEGTSVRLLILHQGETEAEEIEIVRAEIKIPDVYFEMKEDVAYIRISHFSERTNEALFPILESIAQEKAVGIILDLRSNPGGLLEEVVDVTGRFLQEGVVVYVVDNQGQRTSLSIEPGGLTTELPLVVLVNKYSASGSEVLAGALQDYSRAAIAGATTYGKGSVNTLHRLKNGAGLYVTTGRWLTPDGRLIEGEGITPDHELELEGEDTIQWAIDYLKGNKG
ncbi:S41 family peptidase [Chloroflexota bacterium]